MGGAEGRSGARAAASSPPWPRATSWWLVYERLACAALRSGQRASPWAERGGARTRSALAAVGEQHRTRRALAWAARSLEGWDPAGALLLLLLLAGLVLVLATG